MLELKHISYSVREADETLGILKDISLAVDDHKLVVFTHWSAPACRNR